MDAEDHFRYLSEVIRNVNVKFNDIENVGL